MLIYHRCLDAGDLSPLGTRHLGWFGRIKLHADSRDRSQPPFLIFICDRYCFRWCVLYDTMSARGKPQLYSRTAAWKFFWRANAGSRRGEGMNWGFGRRLWRIGWWRF